MFHLLKALRRPSFTQSSVACCYERLIIAAAYAIPYLFGLLLVSPVVSPTGIRRFLVRLITFLLFSLLWQLLKRSVVAFHSFDRPWAKILFSLCSGILLLLVLTVLQGAFQEIPHLFEGFLFLIGISSVRQLQTKENILKVGGLSFAEHFVVSSVSVTSLFGGWSWVPLVLALSPAALLCAVDLSEHLTRSSKDERAVSTLLGVAVAVPGLVALAGLIPLWFTAIYVLLPLIPLTILAAKSEQAQSKVHEFGAVSRHVALFALLLFVIAILIGNGAALVTPM